MKKLLSFSFLLFILSGMGCGTISDSGGHGYYVWINDSDHKITFSAENGFTHIMFQTEMQSGDSFEKDQIRMGVAPPPSDFLAGLLVTVVFDDSIKVIYVRPNSSPGDEYPNVNNGISFNPIWDDNYVQEDVKNGTRWTYTFTNADYEAAVKMAAEIREGE